MWDFSKQELYTFRTFYIPDHMMSGLQRYIENHIQPGDFLSAVIRNDLKDAINYADDENLRNLPAYVGFLYNKAPNGCWGSEELFELWLSSKDAYQHKKGEIT